MKLVIIHGPPATGKLTVAEAIAKKTGYKVFHNHITVDMVHSLFEFGRGPFWELVDRYRIELLEAAAKNRVKGVLFTYCFSSDDMDYAFIQRLRKRLRKHHVTFCIVHLFCEKKELLKRVQRKSRVKFRKMRSPEQLRSALERNDYFTPISKDTLQIDNSNSSAQEVASKIIKHYRLRASRKIK